MVSTALESLLVGVAEVRALRGHFVVRRGRIPSGLEADAAKAHGRACVVLLSSHWERYLRASNEEAIAWINAQRCELDNLPMTLLLKHSQHAIDELAQTGWERREDKLRAFMESDGPIWGTGGRSGSLDHTQLLNWMKSPKPQDVTRLYGQYGITNVFSSITRRPSPRSRLYLDLTELVEKRNLIAHGDATTEALPIDITRYIASVEKFAMSADIVFGRTIKRLSQSAFAPW